MEIPKGLLLSCGVLILTLGLQTTVGSAEVEMSPHLSAFAVPVYPVVARQTGVHGDVTATIEVNSQCQIVQVDFEKRDYLGYAVLEASVKKAIEQWVLSSCHEQPARLHPTFRFILSGDNTS